MTQPIPTPGPEPPADASAADASPTAPPTTPGDAVWSVYGAILVTLAVGALLASARLVTTAERQPAGPQRDLLLTVAGAVHDVAAAVGLQRPAQWVDLALGRVEDGFALAGAPVGRTGGRATPTRPPTRVPAGSPAATSASRSAHLQWPTPGSPRLNALLPAADLPSVLSVPPRAVAPDRPLTLYVAGDSFAQPLAYELARQDADRGLIVTDLDFKLGSGVSRMDFFDWPARIAASQATKQPDVLVFNAGGNDPQAIWTADGWINVGAPEWQTEYGRRAAAIMDTFRGQGVRVYWVGLPVLRDEAASSVARLINTTVMARAARRDWVRFVDTWPLFLGPDGAYAAYLPDKDGEVVQVRQNDGVHLTRKGTGWVAAVVYEAMRQDWRFPEATPTPPPTPPPTTVRVTATPVPAR